MMLLFVIAASIASVVFWAGFTSLLESQKIVGSLFADFLLLMGAGSSAAIIMVLATILERVLS